jgi:tetratricopeptide (TPR) repeat protein
MAVAFISQLPVGFRPTPELLALYGTLSRDGDATVFSPLSLVISAAFLVALWVCWKGLVTTAPRRATRGSAESPFFWQRPSAGVLESVDPESLLLRYTEVIAALVPEQYIASDGLLRLPGGGSEPVRIEVREDEAEPGVARSSRVALAWMTGVVDRPLRHRLASHRELFAADLYADIVASVERVFPAEKSVLALRVLDDACLVHEVFHDIQALLYDHHPDVREKLDQATLSRRAEIIKLYDLRSPDGRMFFWPGPLDSIRWLTTYRPEHLFPQTYVASPYGESYTDLVERFGWPTAFRIRTPVDEARIDCGHLEIIPTLLVGFIWGDNRVIPVLKAIFADVGFNIDFDERFARSVHALPPRRRDAAAASPPVVPPQEAVERPESYFCVFSGDERFPSLPAIADEPQRGVPDGWNCAQCGQPADHVGITNCRGVFGFNFEFSWEERPVAVDAFMCQRCAPPTQTSCPLRLSDPTIEDLIEAGLRAQRSGDFDRADLSLRRAVNARPADPRARTLLGKVFLDRIRLCRMLGAEESKPGSETMTRYMRHALATLETAVECGPPSDITVPLAIAQFHHDLGDFAAARTALGQARNLPQNPEESQCAAALQAELDADAEREAAEPRVIEGLQRQYRELLAALMPAEYLTPAGLLRLPSGGSREVVMSLARPQGAGSSYRGLAALLFSARVKELTEPVDPADMRTILDNVTREHGGPPHITIPFHACAVEQRRLCARESFRDIQAHLCEHHPGLFAALNAAVAARRDRIAAIDTASAADRPPAWAPDGLSLVQLFPESLDSSTGYAFCFEKEAVLPLLRNKKPYKGMVDVGRKAAMDRARLETIPQMLAAASAGDRKIAGLLGEIFAAAGLRTDFGSSSFVAGPAFGAELPADSGNA